MPIRQTSLKETSSNQINHLQKMGMQRNPIFFMQTLKMINAQSDQSLYLCAIRWLFSAKAVLCLLCLCARLFICALWSPAGKGLTSWLSFVVYNCEFVTFPLISLVRCGT